MTEQTRAAIEKLGTDLSMHPWELDRTSIVCPAIDDTEKHAELTFCPLAMAAYMKPDRIDEVLQNPEHKEFAELVNNRRADIREHLKAEGRYAEPEENEELEREATRHAAAAIINDSPHTDETRAILQLEQETIDEIIDAADKPDSESGRALMRALDPAREWLVPMYEDRYGSIDEARDHA